LIPWSYPEILLTFANFIANGDEQALSSLSCGLRKSDVLQVFVFAHWFAATNKEMGRQLP